MNIDSPHVVKTVAKREITPINEPPKLIELMLAKVDGKTHLTESGDYVIKNLDAFRSLEIRVTKCAVLPFYSRKVFTEMRRRFSLAMRQYAIATYRHKVSEKTRASLANLELQVGVLEGILVELEPDVLKRQLTLYGEKLEVRYWCQGERVLRLLIKADRLLGILEQAWKSGEIDDELFQLGVPVESAVSAALTDMIGERKKKTPKKPAVIKTAALLKPHPDLY